MWPPSRGSGPQRGEESVQVDSDRRDDQVVPCQLCILGSSRCEGYLPDLGRQSFYSNILLACWWEPVTFRLGMHTAIFPEFLTSWRVTGPLKISLRLPYWSPEKWKGVGVQLKGPCLGQSQTQKYWFFFCLSKLHPFQHLHSSWQTQRCLYKS